MKYLYIVAWFLVIGMALSACDSKPQPAPQETIEVRVQEPSNEEIKALETAELEEEENNQDAAEQNGEEIE